jgi:hypothetical protein
MSETTNRPDRELRQTIGHTGHGLLMLVCCVPMIVVAVALVATGIAGWAAPLWALGCLVMMTAMMLAMPGEHR